MVATILNMRKRLLSLTIAILVLCLFSIVFYNIPSIHDRLAWRVEDFQAKVRSIFLPPERIQFVTKDQVANDTQATSVAMSPPTLTPTATASPTPTVLVSTPLPSSTPTLTPTPLPVALTLHSETFRYQDQHGLYNYCAPANLAMALSFWGWKGDRLDTGRYLKPYPKDLNVMPYEMENYIRENTDLGVVTRVGGNLDLVKMFIVNGFPVLVEKGVYFRDLSGIVSWMGHFAVITGYDDPQGVFITQDSYVTPGEDYPVPYDKLIQEWRSFNYLFLVIYPKDRVDDVMAILGSNADETLNYQYAAQRASEEIYSNLTDIELFFAWYNRGTNLAKLVDYAGAALAYDEAFAIYNELPQDKSVRPYRILWYQTGPYFAYYYSGRYQTVIDLATNSIEAVYFSDTAPEESLYWRGMAKLAIGDTAGAIADFKLSINPYHPDFAPSLEQLNALGVEP